MTANYGRSRAADYECDVCGEQVVGEPASLTDGPPCPVCRSPTARADTLFVWLIGGPLDGVQRRVPNKGHDEMEAGFVVDGHRYQVDVLCSKRVRYANGATRCVHVVGCSEEEVA